MLTQPLCIQIAGLLASLMVLLVVLAIGFVFQPLPQVGDAAADATQLPASCLAAQRHKWSYRHFYLLPSLLNKQWLMAPLIQNSSHKH